MPANSLTFSSVTTQVIPTAILLRFKTSKPYIILADEPTGALDTNTSIQIMELIKEISKNKLVIMVTHNPELAKKYSSRIVKLFLNKYSAISSVINDPFVCICKTAGRLLS